MRATIPLHRIYLPLQDGGLTILCIEGSVNSYIHSPRPQEDRIEAKQNNSMWVYINMCRTTVYIYICMDIHIYVYTYIYTVEAYMYIYI